MPLVSVGNKKEVNMVKEYKTYAEAVRKRKRYEITIYDFSNGTYSNEKTFKKGGKRWKR